MLGFNSTSGTGNIYNQGSNSEVPKKMIGMVGYKSRTRESSPHVKELYDSQNLT
jgi:hypothetical protein